MRLDINSIIINAFQGQGGEIQYSQSNTQLLIGFRKCCPVNVISAFETISRRKTTYFLPPTLKHKPAFQKTAHKQCPLCGYRKPFLWKSNTQLLISSTCFITITSHLLYPITVFHNYLLHNSWHKYNNNNKMKRQQTRFLC